MVRHASGRLFPPPLPASPDTFHSNIRRATSIRQRVRTIASRLKYASYGRHASVNAPCEMCVEVQRALEVRCCPHRTSAGFRTKSSRHANSPGSRTMPTIARVRSEEHTSELQSLRHLVCRLL